MRLFTQYGNAVELSWLPGAWHDGISLHIHDYECKSPDIGLSVKDVIHLINFYTGKLNFPEFKGTFRDPLIRSILLSYTILIFLHIQKELSNNITSRDDHWGLLQKPSSFYKTGKSLRFSISDVWTLEIVQYSMDRYNSCYPSYLANVKSYLTAILNISF